MEKFPYNTQARQPGSPMDIWLKAEEVAELEGVTPRAVRQRLATGVYSKCRELDGQCAGRGGKQWQIHLSALTPNAQVAYLRKLSGNGNGAREVQEGRMLGLLAYNRAGEDDKALAHIRQEILSAFLAATTRKKGRISQSQFCDLYNKGQVRVLAPDIFQRVKKISPVTLFRWKRDFEEKGIGGLVRKHEKDHEVTSLTKSQQDYIIGLITANPNVRPSRVHEHLIEEFGSAPHFTTIYRYMERWKEANPALYTYLLDPKSWKNSHQLAIGSRAEGIVRFCQRWELDSTPADIICSDGKRYAGVGQIDVFSRLPVVLITESSKSLAIAAVMRRAMIEQGIPEVVIKDHGKDYDSKHIEAVCTAFDIDTPWIPVRAPEYKPFIERFFGTLATSLFEELPGYIGHNVAERQAIRSREREREEFAKLFMTPGASVKINLSRDRLQEIVDKWIQFDYAQRPHKGLNGKRPAEMPALSERPVRRVPDERVMDILLAPAFGRTIQKRGIELDTGWYRALGMGERVGEKVLVRLDMADASKVYVFDLHNNYLFTATDRTLDGLTPEQIATDRKAQKKAVRNAVRSLGELKQTISDSPMLDRLEHLEKTGRAIAPIIRTEAFTNPAVEAARMAVKDQVKLIEPLTDDALTEQVKVISTFEEPEDEELNGIMDRIAAAEPEFEVAEFPRRPIFQRPVDRYKWCVELEASGRVLAPEDKEFARGFEA
ncbi:MAG: Mu transposase C-terminal domain-containing protein, partial [Syntrophobacteraceae bacterium]